MCRTAFQLSEAYENKRGNDDAYETALGKGRGG